MFMNCKTRRRSGQHSIVQLKLGKTYEEVYPEIKRVRGIEVRASSQPLGVECHPSTNQIFNCSNNRSTSDVRKLPSVQLGRAEYDDPIVPRRVIINELFEDIAAQGCNAQDGQQFKGNYGGIGNAPSEIGTCVFFPYISGATCV